MALSEGYVLVMVNGKYEREHRMIAEKALGKPLPTGAVVHHVDGNRANNANSNLVICQDAAYHRLLHIRQRALELCGDPNKRQCTRCGEWDDPENMVPRGLGLVHPEDGPQWEVPRPPKPKRVMVDKYGYRMMFGKWCRNPNFRAKRRNRHIIPSGETTPE